jgi:hypothetical protein
MRTKNIAKLRISSKTKNKRWKTNRFTAELEKSNENHKVAWQKEQKTLKIPRADNELLPEIVAVAMLFLMLLLLLNLLEITVYFTAVECLSTDKIRIIFYDTNKHNLLWL